MRDGHRFLRLAVLNCCEGSRVSMKDLFSGVSTALIQQGIPAVAAMQFPISDKAAKKFAGSFYAALTDGYPADAAMAEARKAVFGMPNDAEWGTPVLYMRSADGLLFRFEDEAQADRDTEIDISEETEGEGKVELSEDVNPIIEVVPPDISQNFKNKEKEDKPPKDNKPIIEVVSPKIEQTGQPKRFTNSIGMEFVWIPPGEFMMGSPENEPGRFDNETLHRVILTRGFYMQTTTVTQGQWKALMGNNPSYFKDGGDKCPVERVSWDDAQEFIKKLNQKEKSEYRLPTEAEWEYACRAGTDTPFYFGKCLSTDEANYDGNYPLEGCSKGIYRKKPVPVKAFPPNAWGLYDMHGNVWEWCHDWYGDYPTTSVTDPTGPDSGSNRVRRGGSWSNGARFCRSAYRHRNSPAYRYDNLGLRLLLPPGQQG
jgi:formylglycine-generating enzyme